MLSMAPGRSTASTTTAPTSAQDHIKRAREFSSQEEVCPPPLPPLPDHTESYLILPRVLIARSSFSECRATPPSLPLPTLPEVLFCFVLFLFLKEHTAVCPDLQAGGAADDTLAGTKRLKKRGEEPRKFACTVENCTYIASRRRRVNPYILLCTVNCTYIASKVARILTIPLSSSVGMLPVSQHLLERALDHPPFVRFFPVSSACSKRRGAHMCTF